MSSMVRRNLVGILVVLVAVVGAAVAGWLLRDSLGANADLTATYNAMLGILGAAAPVALGAVIGAVGAVIVALVNRGETRRDRFNRNALALATNVIVQADLHVRQVRSLIAWLEEWVLGESEGRAPTVDDTQPVRAAYLSLGLLDKDLGTRGEAIYKAILAIDEHTEPLRREPHQEYADWDDIKYAALLNDYFDAMDAFRDEFRSRPS